MGVAEYMEDGIVHTIEGDSGDMCRRNGYGIDSGAVFDYGHNVNGDEIKQAA